MGFARDSGEPAQQVGSSPDLPFDTDGRRPSGDLSGSFSSQNPSGLTLWAHRLSMVILVVFCIELGMLLTVLPWTRVWTENSLLTSYPPLSAALRNLFVRGAITGLGLLDIWIGIGDAVRYTDPGKPKR
jgi:hypothetical protein